MSPTSLGPTTCWYRPSSNLGIRLSEPTHLARREWPPAPHAGLLDLRARSGLDALPCGGPPPTRLGAAEDAPDPGLVRVQHGDLPVPTGGGWWHLVPIWEPDQAATPLRRWEPPVPYWATDT